MRRRDFIRSMAGAAILSPLTARGQSAATLTIGYLGSESPALFASRLRAFHQGLNSTGLAEGRGVAIEYRWAEGRNERLPALAAELVKAKVDVIAAPGSLASALAAKAATATVPVVFETGADPIAAGLVSSLNRPGGNVTGVTSLNAMVGPKRLELLRELIPNSKLFALLVNQTNPRNAEATSSSLQAAAKALNLDLKVLNAATEAELEKAFAQLKELRVSGLVIANDTFFANRSELLASLVQRHAIAAAHQSPEFATTGGLMSYGGDVMESHRQSGVYTGRVLKGEKPADLPVQQVTKVQMVLNLKAAKALGLTIPLSMSGRADELIE